MLRCLAHSRDPQALAAHRWTVTEADLPYASRPDSHLKEAWPTANSFGGSSPPPRVASILSFIRKE